MRSCHPEVMSVCSNIAASCCLPAANLVVVGWHAGQAAFSRPTHTTNLCADPELDMPCGHAGLTLVLARAPPGEGVAGGECNAFLLLQLLSLEPCRGFISSSTQELRVMLSGLMSAPNTAGEGVTGGGGGAGAGRGGLFGQNPGGGCRHRAAPRLRVPHPRRPQRRP